VPCFWLFLKLSILLVLLMSILLVLLISIPATNDFVPEDKLRQFFYDFLDLGLCACAMMITVICKILYTLRQ
jgi:ribose/xylose/arabinose/galactoside ABC-type transport system permease subunit